MIVSLVPSNNRTPEKPMSEFLVAILGALTALAANIPAIWLTHRAQTHRRPILAQGFAAIGVSMCISIFALAIVKNVLELYFATFTGGLLGCFFMIWLVIAIKSWKWMQMSETRQNASQKEVKRG